MSDDAPDRRFVKPAHADARIPDPAHPGIPLSADGADVPWNHYWIARERQGDVVIVDPKASEPAPKTETPAPRPSSPAATVAEKPAPKAG